MNPHNQNWTKIPNSGAIVGKFSHEVMLPCANTVALNQCPILCAVMKFKPSTNNK